MKAARRHDSPNSGADGRALTLTLHAQQRMQQRAVAPDAVSLLLDYGRETRSRGASLFYLDRAGRAQLEKDLGPAQVRKLHDRLDIFVVEGDAGRVVTVSHRTARVRRDVATRTH
jgi:hypothetical protein